MTEGTRSTLRIDRSILIIAVICTFAVLAVLASAVIVIDRRFTELGECLLQQSTEHRQATRLDHDAFRDRHNIPPIDLRGAEPPVLTNPRACDGFVNTRLRPTTTTAR